MKLTVVLDFRIRSFENSTLERERSTFNIFREEIRQLHSKQDKILDEINGSIFSTRLECGFGIFSTRFECSFTSSPLVSSVVLHLLHSFGVWFFTAIKSNLSNTKKEISKQLELIRRENETQIRIVQLELAEVLEKLHSKRVEKM